MKLFRIALAIALALGCAPALAQVNPGTSPLSGPKGGTNNAFMQFSGPATSLKTFTLPNASDTIAALGQIQTWTGAQSFGDGKVVLLGSTSGSSTLKAPATGGGTATLFPGTDTIAGVAASQTLTNKTFNCASNTCTVRIGSDVTGLGAGVGTALGLATNVSGGIVTPTPTRAGDIIYWNGSAWVTLAGNNSGTQLLQETSAGVPSWVTVSGTGTLTSLSAGGGLATGTGAPITTSGTLYAITLPQGRLTLQANTPVMITSQSAQGTLRYDCYRGGRNVPYFNGTDDLSESISGCEVTDVMVSAASAGQVVSGQVYDAWWVHGGANRICLAMSSAVGGGGGWASDTAGSNTARGTGYSQIDTTTRPYITNKNSITNCFNAATNYGPVSVNQGTYLGTVLAAANGQISFTFGASSAGGTAGLFGVWNAYNRVQVSTFVNDSNDSWNVTSATFVSMDGSAGNRVTAVRGLDEDGVSASLNTFFTAAAAGNVYLGIGLDSTTVFSGQSAKHNLVSNSISIQANYSAAPGFGVHFWQALEACSAGTCINRGDNGEPTLYQGGLIWSGRM